MDYRQRAETPWDRVRTPFVVLLGLLLVVHNAVASQFYMRGLVANYHNGQHEVLKSPNFPFQLQGDVSSTYNIYPRNYNSTSSGEGVICFYFRRFQTGNGNYLSFVQGDSLHRFHGDGVAEFDAKDTVWNPNFCWPTVKGRLQLQFEYHSDSTAYGFYAEFYLKPDQSFSSALQPSIHHKTSNGSAPCTLHNQWTCFDRQCITISQKCDGRRSCDDWSDESYAHAGCKVGQYGYNLHACDFAKEQRCGFQGFASPGWDVSAPGDSILDRGPAQDHTRNNEGVHYAYTNFGLSSDNYYRFSLAATNVPLFQEDKYCLSFWYHLMGPRVGHLTVYLVTDNSDQQRPLWRRTANYSDRWLHAEIDLSGKLEQLGKNSGNIHIEGHRSHDYEAVFAIDDISLLSTNACYTDDISCNFEYGLCSWTDNNTRFFKNAGLWPNGGPQQDPVSESGREFYLVTNTDSNTFEASLESPFYGQASDTAGHQYGACLQVWLYLNDDDGYFEIITFGLDNSTKSHATRRPDGWDTVNSDSQGWEEGTWHEFTFDVWHNVPFKIRIQAKAYQSYSPTHLVFAVDEVVVTEGQCNNIELQTCRLDEFRCNDGACIPMTDACDGRKDCADGSDEGPPGCCAKNKCNPGEFCCRNGHCISDAHICDGSNDCGDWSEEDSCSEDCLPGQFYCRDGSRCIDDRYVCDKHADCYDNSDEYECVTYLPPGAIAGIVVVVVLVLIMVLVRVAYWVRTKPQWCRSLQDRCCCRRSNSESSTQAAESRDHATTASELYQQPPGYEECINSQLYKRPDPGADKAPPSYDRIEKGEYETIQEVKVSAIERLKRAMMSKSKDSPPAAKNAAPSTSISGPSSSASATIVPEPNPSMEGHRNNIDSTQQQVTVEINTGRVRTRSDQVQEPSGVTPGTVIRTPSNLSGRSLPNYFALVHPPAYDNLSFCDDNDVMLSDTFTRIHGNNNNMPDVIPSPGPHDQDPAEPPIHTPQGSPTKATNAPGSVGSLYRTESKRLKHQIQRRGARRDRRSEPFPTRLEQIADEASPSTSNTLPLTWRQNPNTQTAHPAPQEQQTTHSLPRQQHQTSQDVSTSQPQQDPRTRKNQVTNPARKTLASARSMPCLAQSLGANPTQPQLNFNGPISASSYDLSDSTIAPVHSGRRTGSHQHLAISARRNVLRKSQSQSAISECNETSV